MDLGSTARALADGETKGLSKLFLDKRSGVLVGVATVGAEMRYNEI
jgi:pyruvate/2-oxoglutarate dehydrogenase complex dihydrolipoamide dehydrogenase (E3) component